MTDYSKITALYSRLSVGDEDRDGGESNSIQNQKIFLENYARGQHLTNIRHYIDDDESGRFFDRSAYSRMMDDVENGKIGVCIMKDLTRWGRDYLQVGNAMEIFRRNNVRFIAVNNGIDSEKPDTLEFAPFINIMSEWYAKDISKKVKTGIKTKGMSGKPIVTEAPYGYVKDPDNKDFWIIDEEAAEVVRLIFRLFIGGKNRNQIAVHLTQEQMLWLSRPSGTFCFRERDVLLKDTQAYNTWKFCGEQTHDRILAYAVELTGAANGTVQGNLYELDYQQHFQHIRDAALPVGANRLIYESGMREIGPKEHFDSRPDKYFGEFVRYEMQPRDPELLQAAIRQEQRSRESAQPGDFKEHLIELHTGLIEAEAQRIAADMKRLAAPNSPDKNHFMVEVSPYFTKLASSRDTDQLIAMLPYKSLHLSSVKDRFGIYALIDKNENRDKGICKPRASVRKQLSKTKQAASPKKVAARSKQHEMEV